MNGSTPVRVVVIGAGYAGVIATNRFLGSLTDAERARVQLTVVNPRAEFVERIRLHELAAGTRESVLVPLDTVLHDAATVLVGSARMIDPDRRTVVVATADDEVTLDYDHLVYALGSHAAAPVPGAREHAFLLGDIDGAQAAAQAIRSRTGQRVLVVGGGLTGVEAAGEIAERHPEAVVTLVSAGPVVASMRPQAQRAIVRTLERLGVAVVAQSPVTEIEPDRALLADGTGIWFDVCLLAASFDVPDLAKVSGLAVDGAGRLRVDEHLRAVDAPEIIGAGDAAVAPSSLAKHLRMSCATALPLGGHAAEVLLAGLRGTPSTPISIGFVLQCISLGRRSGYVQFVHSDDTPRPFHLGGRLAARIKESICTMVLQQPRKERSKPGAYSTPKGPKVAA